MNRVTMKGFDEPARKKFERVVNFVNLYQGGKQAVGKPHSTLERAQSARELGKPYGAEGGLTLKVTRDENGDFTIEKVEEF